VFLYIFIDLSRVLLDLTYMSLVFSEASSCHLPMISPRDILGRSILQRHKSEKVAILRRDLLALTFYLSVQKSVHSFSHHSYILALWHFSSVVFLMQTGVVSIIVSLKHCVTRSCQGLLSFWVLNLLRVNTAPLAAMTSFGAVFQLQFATVM